MPSITNSVTAEDLFLDGTARFAGPHEQNFELCYNSKKPESTYKLALHYLHGYGCARNYPKAIDYFTEASDFGNASASYSLYVLKGERDYLITAALQNHKFAQMLIMRDHANEVFKEAMAQVQNAMGRRQLHKGFPLLQALGLSGHAEALYQLAVHTERAVQDQDNLKHSFNWALQAAQLGHVDAMRHVAVMYMDGRGTNTDMVASLEWHEKAAKGGNTESDNLMNRLLDS